MYRILFLFYQVQEEVKDVKVGTLIALMVAPGEDWKNVEIPSAAVLPPSVPSPPSAPRAKIQPTATAPSEVE